MPILKLYQQYKEDVFRYAYHLCRDKNIAEDLTSDVFLAVILSFGKFRGESDVKTWLFSITRHKWYEYLRKEKKQQSTGDFLEDYCRETLDLEEQYITKEVLHRVDVLLQKEEERSQIIFWKRVEGYSFLEIANQVGMKENSARVVEYRVRQKLKKQLEKEGFHESTATGEQPEND